MITVTTYNSADEILADKLANKTADELIKMWDETERMINALKFNPTGQDRSEQWDAVITVRQWLTKVMQTKMPYDEFCKVVDIPND